MIDPRYAKLADLLINYSTALQADEHILIEAFDMPREMIIAIIKAVQGAQGHAHVALRDGQIMRALHDGAGDACYE